MGYRCRVLRTAGVSLFVVATLAVTAVPVLAEPPEITAVGEQDRHPTILFSAPRAASVTVYVASKRDRATDGTFFQENVVATGLLTDSEIQSGEWLDSSRIDPGPYFVMVQASGDCDRYDSNTMASVTDPSCADGFSSIVRLTISKPRTKFTVKVDVLRYVRVVDLELVGRPLGGTVPYRVCWRQPAGASRKLRKRCRTSSLSGYSWSDDATDSLRIDTAGMARRTTFTWYSRGAKPKLLLSKTIRVY